MNEGQVTVPPATAQKADELKHRMLKVVGYAFGDDPRFSREIIAIRAGTGYEDTANDLQLADLYENDAIAKVIEKDPVFFRDSDAVHARRLAGEIFTALGYDPTAE